MGGRRKKTKSDLFNEQQSMRKAMFDCLKKMGRERRFQLIQFCGMCGIPGSANLVHEICGLDHMKEETNIMYDKYAAMYNVVVGFKNWEKGIPPKKRGGG